MIISYASSLLFCASTFRPRRLAAPLVLSLIFLIAFETPAILQASEPSSNPHKARVVLCGQNAVGEALPENGIQHGLEAASVIRAPMVVAKRLLIQVPLQVERQDGNVSSFERAFQQAPEVFEPVRVDAANHVFAQMVDGLMVEVQAQRPVGGQSVGIDPAAIGHVAADRAAENLIFGRWDDVEPHLATAFQQALHDGLADGPTAFDLGFPLGLVHVPGATADESFVDFNLPFELAEAASFHGEPNAVQHEPRGRLANAQSARKLQAADAVLGVSDAPDCDEPLLERQRAILENRSDLDAELLAAILRLALQQRAGTDNADLLVPACGASDFAIRPFDGEHGFEADFGVGKVSDGLQQGFRGVFNHRLPPHFRQIRSPRPTEFVSGLYAGLPTGIVLRQQAQSKPRRVALIAAHVMPAKKNIGGDESLRGIDYASAVIKIASRLLFGGLRNCLANSAVITNVIETSIERFSDDFNPHAAMLDLNDRIFSKPTEPNCVEFSGHLNELLHEWMDFVGHVLLARSGLQDLGNPLLDILSFSPLESLNETCQINRLVAAMIGNDVELRLQSGNNSLIGCSLANFSANNIEQQVDKRVFAQGIDGPEQFEACEHWRFACHNSPLYSC